ncbi:MAG: polysaccharide biosynthesis/export family protein [Helicobacteraceae bacterium]|jgi:polysaccharide export outer membrane protein|nr:polysaccharide biosynthesis/export family protein [Helicobacteraceae bacterium]
MYKNLFVTVLAVVIMFSGCSMKEYTLFQDENRSEEPTDVNESIYKDEMVFENKIQPNDRVGIMAYNQAAGGAEQLTSMISSRGTQSGSAGADESQGLLVTQEGTVRLPLVGSVKIEGYTEDEAAKFLMEEYGKYLRNPYVTVEIMNQRLFILGEVKNPGVVPVTNGTMNLIEAIARSGDLTDFAERRGVLILRGDLRNPDVRMIDLTQMSTITLSSLYLKPNDIVYVQPRASKGRKIAFDEISPPFQLVSSILAPFVNITYLAKAWGTY